MTAIISMHVACDNRGMLCVMSFAGPPPDCHCFVQVLPEFVPCIFFLQLRKEEDLPEALSDQV